MKLKNVFPFLLIAISMKPGICDAQKPKPNGRFQVVGTKIFDPQGLEFVPRGIVVNGPGWVWPRETTQDAEKIGECWKFNLVRVATYLYPRTHQTFFSDDRHGYNQRIVDAFTPRKVVVMVHAGDNDWNQTKIDSLKNYWRHTAQRFKNNPYVWFNLVGEIKPEEKNWTELSSGLTMDNYGSYWISTIGSLVKIIRDEVGADNPITFCGSFWGQEAGDWGTNSVKTSNSAILQWGKQIINYQGENYRNIIFQVHVYDQWSKGTEEQSLSRLTDYTDRVHALGAPLFIGEFGAKADGSYINAAKAALALNKQKHVGYAGWSWYAGDAFSVATTTAGSAGGGWLINNCENPANLTWWGKSLWSQNRIFLSLDTLPGYDRSGSSTLLQLKDAPKTCPGPQIFMNYHGGIRITFPETAEYRIDLIDLRGVTISTSRVYGKSIIVTYSLNAGLQVVRVRTPHEEWVRTISTDLMR